MRNRWLKIFVMMFLVMTFVLVGCNNTDGNDNEPKFVEVLSVTFTTAGTTRTLRCYWTITRGDYEVATKEDYDNARFKTSVLAPHDVNVNTLGQRANDAFSGDIYDISTKPHKPYGITEDDIGEYFYIHTYDLGAYNHSYFKCKIKAVNSSYVQVKVKNDTTIVVRWGDDGNETTYTVTSYTIRNS